MKKSNTAIITEFFIYILYLFYRRVLSDVYDTDASSFKRLSQMKLERLK